MASPKRNLHKLRMGLVEGKPRKLVDIIIKLEMTSSNYIVYILLFTFFLGSTSSF